LSGKMRRRVRPRPILRLRDQPRAHPIERDVARRRHQVRFIERDGREPVLKEMAGPA
jgi:hypothetical protein